MLVDTLFEIIRSIPLPIVRSVDLTANPEIVHFPITWSEYGGRDTPVGIQIAERGWEHWAKKFRLPAPFTLVEDATSLVALQEEENVLKTGLSPSRRYLVFTPIRDEFGRIPDINVPDIFGPVIDLWALFGGSFTFVSYSNGSAKVGVSLTISEKFLIYRTDSGYFLESGAFNGAENVITNNLIAAHEQLFTFELPRRLVVEEVKQMSPLVSRSCSVLRSMTPEELEKFNSDRKKPGSRPFRVMDRY